MISPTVFIRISLYNILELIILYNSGVRKWDVYPAKFEERRMHIVMEEKMNEEQPLEDGQREEDDIDYVEDREELTEERIKDMLDARE